MKNHLIAFILLSKSLANADDSTADEEMIKTLFHHNQPWVKIHFVHLSWTIENAKSVFRSKSTKLRSLTEVLNAELAPMTQVR